VTPGVLIEGLRWLFWGLVGHCLGLSHRNGGEASVMFWVEGHERWSATVTPADLDAVRALHR
jgi:hypothetical protein